MDRRILDLCGGTGAWSAPYREAGYDVEVIDLPNDVRLMQPNGIKPHGILAAPPCTYFCTMRNCRGKPTDEQLLEGLSVVDACIRLITFYRPAWWALENPSGRLDDYLGPPRFKFHPWEFGDPWTKRTWIWGDFVPPLAKRSALPVGPLVKSGKKGALNKNGLASTFEERAKTPPGFARAFFEANP